MFSFFWISLKLREQMLQVLNILEPTTWDISKISSPWFEGEAKLKELSSVVKLEINVFEFREFVEHFLKTHNPTLIDDLPTLKAAKSAMKVILVSDAESDSDCLNEASVQIALCNE